MCLGGGQHLGVHGGCATKFQVTKGSKSLLAGMPPWPALPTVVLLSSELVVPVKKTSPFYIFYQEFLFPHSPYPASYQESLFLGDMYPKDLASISSPLWAARQRSDPSCPVIQFSTDCTSHHKPTLARLSAPASFSNSPVSSLHLLCSSPLC